MSTLQGLGYLEQPENDRRYRLSVKVTDLGLSAQSSTALAQLALPQMRELGTRTTLAVGLAVLDGTEIAYLQRLCQHHLTQDSPPRGLQATGSRSPAYCTAAGKVLLAGLSETACVDVLERVGFERHGGCDVTESRRRLLVELDDVVVDEIAINDEEDEIGCVAIAVAVRDDRGEVIAALSVIGVVPEVSVRALLDDHRPALDQTARQISQALGYRAHERGPQLLHG